MKYALFMDQCKIFYFIFCTCRFSSRVLIENKKTRQLLASYAKRGMSTVEMEEVMREVNLHAPFLTPLLSSIDKASENSHTCPPQWKRFILLFFYLQQFTCMCPHPSLILQLDTGDL